MLPVAAQEKNPKKYVRLPSRAQAEVKHCRATTCRQTAHRRPRLVLRVNRRNKLILPAVRKRVLRVRAAATKKHGPAGLPRRTVPRARAVAALKPVRAAAAATAAAAAPSARVRRAAAAAVIPDRRVAAAAVAAVPVAAARAAVAAARAVAINLICLRPGFPL